MALAEKSCDKLFEIYRELCEYFGGKNWRVAQTEGVFRHIREQIIPFLVQGGFDSQSAKRYCTYAENCLLTDAPFCFYKKKIKLLIEASKIVEKDKGKVPSIEKWKRAFKKMVSNKQ